MTDPGDDQYFGFDYNALSNISSPPAFSLAPPGYEITGTYSVPELPTFYSDKAPGTKDAGETDPGNWDFSGNDISSIYLMIKGEQPGTAEERAQQWNNVSVMLQGVSDQLRDQTVGLIRDWESPSAKKVFLSKVGMTLAYVDVWQQAAIENSTGLYGLAQVMREGQAEMENLYNEYAIMHAFYKDQAENPDNINYVSGTTLFHEKDVQKNQKEYDAKARKLADKIASNYAPYLQQLESGRAKMVEKLNAVAHPEALGDRIPNMPQVTFGRGGSAPNGIGANSFDGHPPTPNASTGNPPSPNKFTANPLLPDAVNGKPPGPHMAPPTAALNAPPTPDIPVPNLMPPGPLAITGAAAGLLARAFNGDPVTANRSFPGMGPGLLGGNTPGGVPSTLGENPSGAPPSSLSQNSPNPPGTMSPPPGGQLPQERQKQDKRPNGLASGSVDPSMPNGGFSSPPPGSTPSDPAASRKGQQGGAPPVSPLELSRAFQPPPVATPQVLENAKKRARDSSRTDAAASSGTAGSPLGRLGTPPVLSNPRREDQGRGRSFAERFGEAKRARQRKRAKQEQTEFTSGLPTSVEPVFLGRLADGGKIAGASAGEIPAALRAPEHTVSTSDSHARPVEWADRTSRNVAVNSQEEPADHLAFDVQTPGGPMVANETQKERYRPEPPAALGKQN